MEDAFEHLFASGHIESNYNHFLYISTTSPSISSTMCDERIQFESISIPRVVSCLAQSERRIVVIIIGPRERIYDYYWWGECDCVWPEWEDKLNCEQAWLARNLHFYNPLGSNKMLFIRVWIISFMPKHYKHISIKSRRRETTCIILLRVHK